MANGIIILHKEAGMTSHTAVARLRRLYGGEKAGHTGTLDPMATGVLPVLIGRAVKASAYMIEADKHYLATLRLGVTTDTEDTEGAILTQTDNLPSEKTVLETIKSFLGEGQQIPPMYSAIKVGGRRLMDLARAGQTVERQARPITIYDIQAKTLNAREYTLDVQCSKGTYIRTLCADIGAKLGCGGVMASLCRVEAARFALSQAHTLSEIEAMDEEQRAALVIPTEHLFKDYPAVSVPPFYVRLTKNGQAPATRKLNLNYPVGTRLRLYDGTVFYALAIVEEADEPVVRTITLFVL